MKTRHWMARFGLVALLLLAAPLVQAAEIKCATLAPKGSTWDKIMTQMNNDIQASTGGAVKFSIYAGGVMGDEKDVVKKMQINQIQCAGLTGMGLGAIQPALRVMELPMLFDNYQQVDKAFSAMDASFRNMLDQKGYVLLGWANPGFVYLYSRKAIANQGDMKGTKVWVWSGDKIGEAMTRALGLNAVPLSITDVLTSLQTGMIDTVYAPGLAAVALQWYTRVKYYTNFPLVHSMGALIIKKSAFNQLSAPNKKILKDKAAQYMSQLTTQTRTENQQSLQAMQASGIKKIDVADADAQQLKLTSEQVWNELTGVMYPANVLVQVKAAR